MNNQKGITLISLIVYIVVLTIILSILSMVSEMFFTNIEYITDKGKYVSEFNKFNMYFVEDIKNNKEILQINGTNTEIIFEDGTVYTFSDKDKSIYRNKVKICKNISNCIFSKSEVLSGEITKKLVKVEMLIKGSSNLKTSNEYVLKYW